MNTNEIADLSTVSAQRTFLQSHPKKPEAKSTLYLTRSTTDNAKGGQHHTIVGVHIVLAEGDPNGLWKELHRNRGKETLNAKEQKRDDTKFLMATRSLMISCDTLEVHGEFSVPEADVTIFARRLVWATPDAGINTSPLPWDLPKAPDAVGTTPGENGANGRHAGSLKVFVSAVECEAPPRPRLVAQGGRGQDPGEGSDGKNGADMPPFASAKFEVLVPKVRGLGDPQIFVTNSATVGFSPPAVYIDAQWYAGFLIPTTNDKRGSNSWPTSGANAVAAGIPGDGGNGGNLMTNSMALAACLKNDGGLPGNKGQDRVGGRAGTPSPSAMYSVEIQEWYLSDTDKATFKQKMTGGPHTTNRGSDAAAKPAPYGPGLTPDPAAIDCPTAWLHPFALQTVLEYARDLFLAGDQGGVQEVLHSYEEALALPAPKSVAGWDDTPWEDSSMAQWRAAQGEVASMLQRVRGHLDYFGNPAGYMPLLSLQGAIKLYAGETRRALRTLLLVDWINDETRKAEEAIAVFGDVIDGLNEDSRRAADQVTASEEKIRHLNEQIDGFEQDLIDKGNQLAAKRTELLSIAENTERREAQIKFGIKMAGAICQVIPVGQPALGAVGSMSAVAADLIGSDLDSTPDTVSKMGDVITKAREAAKKAEEARKKAAKEMKEAGKKNGKETDASQAKDVEAAKDDASAWGQALDGVGPAFSQVSGAMKALQVPQSEVEAQLQRLESECPELQQLLQDIRDLNSKKVELFGNLANVFQSLSDGYSRLSLNSAAVVSMQQQRSKQLGRVDHEASLFVRQVGQRSRLILLKYLYFMVKAYETTILKPLDGIDWELSNVTAKISQLLKAEKGFDAQSLNALAETLDSLFQQNIDVVRQKLLEDSNFSEVTMPRTLPLSSTQSRCDLDDLNDAGRVVIDPVVYGLVLPDRQLARLGHVVLTTLEFDSQGPQLPDGHDVIVDMIPAHLGTLRRNEALYAIYSDAPVRWSWTYLGGQIKPNPPSKGAEDLLDFILGQGSDKIRQKVARPPVWSDLTIQVQYSPALPKEKKPRITRLFFEMSCDVTPAPHSQRVLRVQPIGPSAGSIVECSPEDLATRGPGFGQMIRIFNEGANVRLSVPARAFGASFDHWRLIGTDPSNVAEPEVNNIKLKDHVIAECYWVRSDEREATSEVTELLDSESLAALADSSPDEKIRKALRMHVEAQDSAERLRAAAPAAGQLIRVEARDDSTILGCVPPEGEADLLEEGADGWQKVNYRGVAGWIKE